MKVFVYIVAASKNPDYVECIVPFEVNNDIIFFGPCKKRLRRNLYEWYLKNSPNGEKDVSSEDLYVIGLNGSNSRKERKITWVGKILKILTFEKAYHSCLSDKQFKKMMQQQGSPLNLEPIYDSRKTFIGYKLRSTEHKENDDWILDVIEKRNDPNVEIDFENKTMTLRNPSNRKEIFLRDCCFLCENIFFARGKGIDIKEDILNIFKKAQPNKRGIDNYAIFGLREDGGVDGLTGNYLEISGRIAKKMIAIVTKKAKTVHTGESLKKDTLRRGKCRRIISQRQRRLTGGCTRRVYVLPFGILLPLVATSYTLGNVI